MSTQIPFPNKRISYSGIGNPLFITDIENATEDLLEALAVLYGFASNGFAILSGFNYGAGAYTGGIVYMNGLLCRCVDGLTENQYLTPDVKDVDNKIFSDANIYPTYRIYQAIATGAQWAGMPQFVGNMNQYRISIKKIYDLATQVASSTQKGIVELATTEDVIAGVDENRAVTPAGLQSKITNYDKYGLIRLATPEEVANSVDSTIAITPYTLSQRIATINKTGIVELATTEEVIAGVDENRAITPAALVARTATETRTGIIALATNTEIETGTEGSKAVSPAGLAAKDGGLITKYIDFTGWNMDTTDSHFVNVSSLGILASKVKEITASVIDSIGAPSSLLGSNGSMRTTSLSGSNIGGITLYRVTGGLFDNVNFNNASGSIVIRYLP